MSEIGRSIDDLNAKKFILFIVERIDHATGVKGRNQGCLGNCNNPVTTTI